MIREEHLRWCKTRALNYLYRGDLSNAIAAMLSDIQKHPETRNTFAGMLAVHVLQHPTPEHVRDFIEGFN